MTSVSLAARPEAITIDLDRSAVIVIDMQNDFGAEGGMFDRAGIDIAPIRRLVPRISGVLEDARAAGLPIVYTKQQHRVAAGLRLDHSEHIDGAARHVEVAIDLARCRVGDFAHVDPGGALQLEDQFHEQRIGLRAFFRH
jgi:hypothetical protein